MEVRQATSAAAGGGKDRGLGLFAAKDYNVGDLIMEDERPLFRLAPLSSDEGSRLAKLYLLDGQQIAPTTTKARAARSAHDVHSVGGPLWSAVQVPETVPEDQRGKFKGMVQAGLCFLDALQRNNNDDDRVEKLLELYHPKTDTKSKEEQEILGIADLAFQYIVDSAKAMNQPSIMGVDEKKELEGKLRKVLLIWSCNSFEGGRIYEIISRINHSCNPNAMIQTNSSSSNPPNSDDDNDDKKHNDQSVRALTLIRAGDEITISYLGLFLYAERPIRQSILQTTKHFTCDCSRCKQELEDPAKDTPAYVPCPLCNPRESGGRQLDEEAQYDDDGTASYICGWSMMPNSETEQAPSEVCQSCRGKKSAAVTKTWGKDKERLTNAMQHVRDKVVAFLHGKRQPNRRAADENRTNNDKDDDHDDGVSEAVQSELLDQHIRLASSVMGARHWTTNLLLLFQLDAILQSIHGAILLNDETPDMTVLAEAIDILQRLVKFVDGFSILTNMDHKKGHLLSSVMIGTARALVSLSDVKSQRYAVEWVEPIRDYVRIFEAPGMLKVLDTIANAHKKHENQNDDNDVGGDRNEESKRRGRPNENETKEGSKKAKKG
ncbi:hypothetical protein ACA910_021112 [Epithemia clementina (nom. ined.)]